MSSPARMGTAQDEAHSLEALRQRYEQQGFTFTVDPAPAMLPHFLGSYRLDAVAAKPGFNVAIEIKSRGNSSAARSITDMRKLFAGHDDWRLDVVFLGSDPPREIFIPAPVAATVQERMNDVVVLNDTGQTRAAFLLAWSLLEAALRAIDGNDGNHRPRAAGALIQALAMNGHIAPETERSLRDLAAMRNRIVHGDLSIEPGPQDVPMVLAAIDETLAAEIA